MFIISSLFTAIHSVYCLSKLISPGTLVYFEKEGVLGTLKKVNNLSNLWISAYWRREPFQTIQSDLVNWFDRFTKKIRINRTIRSWIGHYYAVAVCIVLPLLHLCRLATRIQDMGLFIYIYIYTDIHTLYEQAAVFLTCSQQHVVDILAVVSLVSRHIADMFRRDQTVTWSRLKQRISSITDVYLQNSGAKLTGYGKDILW